MNTLSKELRNQLARVTLTAREAAEEACRAALENLAVHEKDYRPHMTVEQRKLRNQLRARGRALGDVRDERSGLQEIRHLAEAAAYEQWHRLLFTRFLTENGLLHTDESQGNVPVTLQDCEELAPELGARDGFDLACRFASKTLPGVFRSDDPALTLRLALNHEVELRKILDSLPSDIFLASDSLGWTYQFWQAERKDQVNASGNKIGADELPSVTQLFTEDYMVDFLLDNTLGAWHAGKVLATNPRLAEKAQSEDELRQAVALPGCPWKYLRFIKGKDGKWTPAAGTFEGWPKSAAALRALDPCMGSGHFVVAMFERLVALRLAEEKLDEVAAVAAVIRDNLFGLEIDARCTQIGAFNLALAAWRRVGYYKLPAMNLACSGLAPNTREADWLAIAGDNQKLQRGMERLYRLFQKAAVLGSLINPRAGEGDLLVAAFNELQPLLEKALAQETKDDIAHEMAVTARGLAKAAEILAGQFTLVATNVPYLGRGKQDAVLQDYCERVYPESKADLATCFVERCVEFAGSGNSTALVTPQSWLFMGTYKKLRAKLLASIQWDSVGRLGARAFETISGEVVNVALLGFTRASPDTKHTFAGVDVAEEKLPTDKAEGLQLKLCKVVLQSGQTSNPDSRISFNTHSNAERVSKYASSFLGLGTGDYSHYGRCFWEFPQELKGWAFQQCTVESPMFWGGREHMIAWDRATGRVRGMTDAERVQIHNQDQSGQQAWGRKGVAVGLMQDLRPTLYTGETYEKALAVLLPQSESLIPALWAYCSDPSFNKAVRELEHNVIVANGTLVKVPFDLEHWQKVATKKYPDGLPKPFSSDPTQWLFNGHPKDSDQPLHVAVARLVGYQWPRLTGSSFPDCPALKCDGLEKLADDDGIVCLPPLNREQPAANRVRDLLAKALGKFDERALIKATGSDKTNLEDWLRDDFFEQHCKLFHQCPFIWHIWDGRKDGFHALVNYHKLDHAILQKLTYSYLGDWIRHQEEDAKAEKPGADARLGAARALQTELAKILEGEAPYDIFVRWKPLAKQAKGWHPDLNDGVRLNIRPFMLATDVGKKGAGILRNKPGIKWDKDRGKEPKRDKAEYPWFWCEEEPDTDPVGGKNYPDKDNRWNNVHLTLEQKRKARES
jgi:hypothetical protein